MHNDIINFEKMRERRVDNEIEATFAQACQLRDRLMAILAASEIKDSTTLITLMALAALFQHLMPRPAYSDIEDAYFDADETFERIENVLQDFKEGMLTPMNAEADAVWEAKAKAEAEAEAADPAAK